MRQLCAAVLLALPMALPAAQADPLRIAALGDSLTQGYGLVPDDGLVPQLQAWLSERIPTDVVIVNAGVSGDTTAGGLARIAWTLDDRTDALIVALGGNDMLRGIDPAVSRSNLAGILEAAAARDLPVLLVGMEAPGNYGADYKAAFDAMYPDLAERYGALLVPSMLAPLAGSAAQGAPLDPTLMQPDGIHPNRAGVAAIVDAIGPAVLALAERAAEDG